MSYAIEARRSGRVCGAAVALNKDRNRNVIYYDTMEEAQAEASRINEQTVSFYVSYRAVEA